MRKWFALVTTAVLVTGCGGEDGIRRYPAVYPKSQAEAGTTTMAVVAVERWQDIAGSLKPNFTLTGDNAAANVLPETSRPRPPGSSTASARA